MAIQNVNGRNAYVIQAEVPTARTSTGEGYGSLYSNLRWKLWEKAEESTKAAIGFEKMAYQAQLDFAMKQRADIQKRVSAYDREIARLEAGEAKDNSRIESKRDDDALKVGRDTRSMEFSANKAAAPSTTSRADTKSSSSTKVGGIPVDIPEGATGSQVPASTTSPTATFVKEGQAIPPDAKLPDGSYAVAGSLAPAGGVLVQMDTAPTSLASPPPPAGAPFEQDKTSIALKGAYETRPERSDTASESRSVGGSTTSKTRAAVPKAPNLPTREDVDYSEALAKLRQERLDLQGQLGEVTLPQAPSVDLLERTRAKYEQSYGTGGMFGIANRPDKIQPRFDEPAALKSAQAIAGAAAEDAVSQYRAEKLAKDPAAIITPAEEQEARRRGVINAIGKLGGREVSAKDFLGVDGRMEPIERKVAPVVEAPVAREPVKSTQFTPEDEFMMEAGVKPPAREPVAGEFVPLPPTAGMEPPPVPMGEAGAPPSYADAMEGFRRLPVTTYPTYQADGLFPVGAEMPRLRKPSRFPIDRTTPEGRAFEEETRRIEAEKKSAGTFIRNPFGRTAVERTQDLLSLGMTPEEVSRIAPVAAPAAPIAPPVAAPIPQPSIWDTIDKEPIAVPPVAPTVAPPALGPEMGGITVPPVDRRSPEELKAALEEFKKKREKTAADKKAIEELQKRIGFDKLPSSPPPEENKKSGALERREQYKLALIEKATKLANQPKKFERLAKPNLPPEQRKSQVPEYIILVDNLYDTNERSGNEPVKASYEEINRVFADKPEIRAAAQEYLLAKDLLSSKSKNPEV